MKVLLIEDNAGDVELISRALRKGSERVEFHAETRLHDALDRTDLGDFDVILADLSLPDSTGLNSVNQLSRKLSTMPIIVLTSLMSDAVAVEAIRHGAQDYIVKDHVTAEFLERTIRHSIERQSMRSENERLLVELEESKSLLEKKNARLERVCEAAQQSIDNVSHEFRTPLTVILEYASIIRDEMVGEVNGEQRRFLDIIGDRGNDLNNMVNDMLDVSRLESGLLGVARTSIPIEDVIARVTPSLQRKADVRSVNFEVEIDDNLSEVFCDGEKIGRVIINLVVNAIKFAGRPGKVKVSVTQPNQTELRVSIADNGQGIPPERLQEIFGRFAQLEVDAQQSAEGFGLGLNIAQSLINLNFGKMQVESVVGKGSTFSFTIPVSDPLEITRRYAVWLAAHRDATGSVSAISVACNSECDSEEIDTFLRHVLRSYDLVFQSSQCSWLLLVNTPSFEVDCFLQRIQTEHEFLSRNRPLGPLDDISMTVEGSWQLSSDIEDLLNYVSFAFEELCNV